MLIYKQAELLSGAHVYMPLVNHQMVIFVPNACMRVLWIATACPPVLQSVLAFSQDWFITFSDFLHGVRGT